MENQTPIRPWSRLASLARMEAAQGQTMAPVSAPAPPRPPVQAPVPRIPFRRAPTMNTQAPPTLQQETLPLPPPQQQPSQQQQPSRQQASPPPPSPRIRIPSRDPTPPESPRVIRSSSSTPAESPRVIRSSSSTPAESPRTRTFRPSPAPPSPNPEPERKPSPNPEPEPNSVMENIFIRQERSTSSVKAPAEISKESGDDGGATPLFPRNIPAANKTSATSRKKDDGGTWKAITIAGENMGSYMELGSSQHHHQKHQKEKHQNGHQQYQGLEIESGSEVGTAGKKGEKNERKPIAAVVNSNVQSVNNSLLLSSKCRLNSPGVHLALASHRHPKPSRGSSATDPPFAKRN